MIRLSGNSGIFLEGLTVSKNVVTKMVSCRECANNNFSVGVMVEEISKLIFLNGTTVFFLFVT